MISIVIPLYNEEENVDQLYKRLTKASPLWKEDYEIIFVDDGSWDTTCEKLRVFQKQDPHIKVIKFSRNFGHQAAITAGINLAKGDATIIMDGDLQDPPEILPKFLDKWREGYHVVYAIRTKRKEGFMKRISYSLFYLLLQKISNIDIPLDSGDFCIMDKKVTKVLKTELIEHSRFVRGLRAYAGFKQTGLAYERHERAAGEVKFTFRKLLKLAMDGLLDFSTFPLRLATYTGFLIAIPSFLIGLFFIAQRIFNFSILGHTAAETPGIATLAVGVFFLGGVILLFLGLIGEYIGRMYFEVKKRPFYIIDETYVNNDTST